MAHKFEFMLCNANFYIKVLVYLIVQLNGIQPSRVLTSRKSGGVLKSMLTLNEAIIDVKEG